LNATLRWDDYREEDLVHARLAAHLRAVAKAQAAAEAWLGRCARPYVACSGGKDSVAMLHLVQEVARRIRARGGNELVEVMWHDSGVEWPGTAEVFERLQAAGLVERLHVVRPEEDVVALKRRQLLGQITAERKDDLALFRPIRRFLSFPPEPRTLPFDGVALGLRSEESSGRAVSRATHGLVYQRGDGMLVCQPLADWSWRDVFAYVATHRLPLHPIYSAPLLHLEHRGRIRLSWWASTDHHRHGELAWVKANFPDLYTRLVAAIPEAKRLPA
jgi:phosphoadenosine phosphosulfate reductase